MCSRFPVQYAELWAAAATAWRENSAADNFGVRARLGIFHAKKTQKSGGVSLLTRLKDKALAVARCRVLHPRASGYREIA